MEKSTQCPFPYGTVKDILKDKELSALILDDVKDTKHKKGILTDGNCRCHGDRPKNQTGKGNTESFEDPSSRTATQLSELAKYPVSTMVQMGISYSTAWVLSNLMRPQGSCIWRARVLLCPTPVDVPEETRVIRYVPGDDKRIHRGCQSLVTLADPPSVANNPRDA